MGMTGANIRTLLLSLGYRRSLIRLALYLLMLLALYTES